MTDLMLPASALKIERCGVPQDSNAAVVSSASFDEIPPAVVVTTAKASATTTTLAPGKSKKRKASSAGAERWHFPHLKDRPCLYSDASLPSTARRSSGAGTACCTGQGAGGCGAT
jgi:hypothetical protein